MKWKFKTGSTVNQQQIPHAPRHTLLFLWACFTIPSLCRLSFWKLVIILLIQRNMWMAVQQAMKSGQNGTFSLLFESVSLTSPPWEFLQEPSPHDTHSKLCVSQRKGEIFLSSSWLKMVFVRAEMFESLQNPRWGLSCRAGEALGWPGPEGRAWWMGSVGQPGCPSCHVKAQ